MPCPPSPRRPVRRYEPSCSGSPARRGAVSGMDPPSGHCLLRLPSAYEGSYVVLLISQFMEEPLSVNVMYEDVGQVPPLRLVRIWLKTTLVSLELDGCSNSEPEQLP